MQKCDFLKKLSNLELWCLLTTYTKLCKLDWALHRTHYCIPITQDGWDTPSWKSTWRHFFSADGDPIWIKFRRNLKINVSPDWYRMTCGDVWKWKPDVEFQYGGRLGEFNGMSFQSHVSHCRVLPLDEFTVTIPEPHTACHIAGCSHLTKSMSW